MRSFSLRVSTRLFILVGLGVALLGIVAAVYLGQRVGLASFLEGSEGFERAALQIAQQQRDTDRMNREVSEFVAKGDEANFSQYRLLLDDVRAPAGSPGAEENAVSDTAAVRERLDVFVASVEDLAATRRRLGLTENQGLEGALREAVHALETRLAELDKQAIGNSQMAVDQLAIKMLMMRRHEKDFMLRGEAPEYIGRINERRKEFESLLSSAPFFNADKEALQGQLATYVTKVTEYAEAFSLIARQQQETEAAYRALVQELDRVAERVNAQAAASNHVFQSVQQRNDVILAGTVILGLAALILGGLVVSQGITRPLRALTRSMEEIASDNLDQEISGLSHRDEIGAMAASVLVFRENALAKRQLESARIVETRQAELDKREMIEAMAASFENKVGGLIRMLSAAAGELEATAQTMSETAEQTNHRSASVAETAEQTSASVQTVAAAAEELSASISEIARQVTTSSKIAADAVDSTRQTDRIVAGLADSASRIGEVVALINNIAEKTNLLALNATIEAARAGEAGRGFAVVASEVKSLAGQTAQATGEIADKIAEVQASVQQAVAAISAIGGTIAKIDEISAAVALAVDHQGVASQEISSNVQLAAHGTQTVYHSITVVKQGATDTGAAAAQVLASAEELARHAAELSTEVDTFLREVRAA